MIRRLVPLIRLASEYTAAHLTARFLAAISGLLLVRILPVNEYGFYTLVLAAFTFICTFFVLFATETLSFFRWRAGKKSKSWVPYFHAVMRFRRMVFMFAFISSAAYVLSMGLHLGIEISTTLIAISLIGLSAWLAIHSGIIAYVLKLEQRFRQAYVVELSNEGAKFIAVCLICFFGYATSLAGMASIAIGSLLAAILATKLLDQRYSQAMKPIRRHVYQNNRALLGQILPILPGTIYFTLQGPLIAWLAAFYGSLENVAEVGALGRLGALIGFITGFSGTVFVPRLLAIIDETLFLKRYLQWWLVMLVFGGAIIAFVCFSPKGLLFLLGNSYSGLSEELLISAVIAVIASFGAFSWHINRARGWIKYQPYRVPVILSGQIFMFPFINFATTQGVLLFSLGTVILDFVFQVLLNGLGFLVRK